MKAAALFLVTTLAIAMNAFAQGTILFDTHVPGIVDAPFSFNLEPPGPRFGAELLLPDFTAGTLLHLSPTTTFKTGSDAFYVDPVVVTVPDKPPGSTVAIAMGVFELSNPNGPFCVGQSTITVRLGGGDLPPAYLMGLGPSDLPPDCLPEPSGVALLGIAGLGSVVVAGMKVFSPGSRSRSVCRC